MVDWRGPLAYALLGRIPEGLAPAGLVDVGAFLADLTRLEPTAMAELRDATRAAGVVKPRPVPAELRGELGYAQLSALLDEVAEHLSTPIAGRVVTERAPDAAERRLIADAPPHHRG